MHPFPADTRPAVPHIAISAAGCPYITGSRCKVCGETFVGARTACARCCEVGNLDSIELGQRGQIHTYTVVHRSFPGIATPFVSALVALDGGGSVHVTVRNVDDLSAALFGLPVRLVFEMSGQVDREGRRFLAYHAVPQGNGGGAQP
jgi:uncharacterized protein